MKFLEICLVSCWIKCKCCKDCDNLPMCLIIMCLCKCANLKSVNCNERTILIQFLLSCDDDYIRGRPYYLNKVRIINDTHFKMDSSLAPNEL